jgi:hypothetical protein
MHSYLHKNFILVKSGCYKQLIGKLFLQTALSALSLVLQSKLQVQEIVKLVKKIRGLKQRRKNWYLLSQFLHSSSSLNSKELTGWNSWPQHWNRPSGLFLPQEEEQKQWPRVMLPVH